jgi:hypothetical protein
MRVAPLLIACAVLSSGALPACRSRLPVDHVPRPAPTPEAAPAPASPPVPPVETPAPPVPPEAAARPLLHVEYYQISDG